MSHLNLTLVYRNYGESISLISSLFVHMYKYRVDEKSLATAATVLSNARL